MYIYIYIYIYMCVLEEKQKTVYASGLSTPSGSSKSRSTFPTEPCSSARVTLVSYKRSSRGDYYSSNRDYYKKHPAE